MKFKVQKLVTLLTLLCLCSCNNSTSPIDSTSNDSSSSSSQLESTSSTSLESSSTTIDEYDNIDVVKTTFNVGDSCKILGTIAGYQKNSDGYSGAYIVGDTGSIYCYSKSLFNNTKIGDKVEISGQFSKYISKQEATLGENIGWYGSRQIEASSVTVISENNTYLDLIEETTIRNVVKSNHTTNDITSNVYKAPCKITKVESSGYKNYYFYDESLDYSVYAYSTMSGADYEWIDSYVDKVHYVYFGIQGLRPKDQVWRIIPLTIDETILSEEYSDDKKVEFALNRLEDQFQSEYSSYGPVELITDDSKLENETITYSSENGVISNGNSLTVNPNSYKGNASVIIHLTYNGKEYTRIVNFVIKEDEVISDIKTIQEVMNGNEGDIVTVQGVYARFAANTSGVYIIDDTGILDVNYTTLNNVDLIIGETVTFKGKIKKDFENLDSDGNTLYAGHNTLIEAELLKHDGVVSKWNTSIVSGTTTVSDLLNTDLTRIGKIYQITGKVVKVSEKFFSNMNLYDSDGTNKIALYCSSASQLAWLDDYLDEVNDYYLYVRDSKTGTKLRVEILDLVSNQAK